MGYREIDLKGLKTIREYFADLKRKAMDKGISSLKRESTDGDEYDRNLIFVDTVGTHLAKYTPSSLDFLAKNGYSIHQSVVSRTSQSVVRNMGSIDNVESYNKEKGEWLLDSDRIDQAQRVIRAYEEILPIEIELRKQKKVRVLEEVVSQFGLNIE